MRRLPRICALTPLISLILSGCGERVEYRFLEPGDSHPLRVLASPNGKDKALVRAASVRADGSTPGVRVIDITGMVVQTEPQYKHIRKLAAERQAQLDAGLE